MADNTHDDLGFVSDDDLGFVEETVPSPSKLANTVVNNIVKSSVPAVSKSGDILASLGESALDTSRGVGQGLLMGATDEIGGGLSALIEKAMNTFDPTNAKLAEQGFKVEQPELADLYRKNQQDIQAELKGSQERSPWLYTAGQIAGGMTSGSAVGGLLGMGKNAANAKSITDIARNEGKLKALAELGLRGGKAYVKAAPAIALESALSSEKGGLLDEQERNKLLEDTVGGLMFGIPTVAGLEAVTEVAAPLAREAAKGTKNYLTDLVKETPLLRQMKVSYDYGKQGINPKSQSVLLNTDLNNPLNLTQLDNNRTQKLISEIEQAGKKIGQTVSESLQKAEVNGQIVNLAPDTLQTLRDLSTLTARYPEITANPRAGKIFAKITEGGTDVTPTEAKDVIDYMDAYINKFKASTNITPSEQGILSNLLDSRKRFSNTLKIAIPEYRVAAERYSEFMKLVPETIISGSTPVSVEGKMASEMNNFDKKLFDQLKRLNQGATKEGSAQQSTREAFVNTVKGLKTFEQQEADRVAKGLINDSAFARTASEIEDEIKKNADDAVARSSMDALEPHTGIPRTFQNVITGTGETGRSMALSAANVSGRMSKKIAQSPTNPVSKIASSVYNAPNETTLALSQKLKQVPELQKYGVSLEDALNSPDQNKRNQVLFTIMQNPKARAFIKDEEQVETPQQ